MALAGLSLLLFAGLEHAAHAASAPGTSGTSATANSPLVAADLEAPNKTPGLFESPAGRNTEVPVQTRPFVLTLPRDHLFGDWYGLLPALADLGITPTVTYVTDDAGNPIGGRTRGVSYDDNIGIQLLFDLKKIVGLDGGSLLVSMSQRDGDSLSQKDVENAFTIQQIYGGQTFHLIDFEYQQKLFDDKIEFSIGRLAAGDDFLVSPYDYLFMQNAFDGNPVGIFFNSPGMTAYPNSTWGSRVTVRPTRRAYLMAGLYNGDPAIRANYRNGADLSMHGPPFAIAEFGYKRNGLPGDSRLLGNYKAGAWYDAGSYTDYRTLGKANPAIARRGNWGFYGLFDQVLVPFAEPYSNRGFGVFGSLLVSPDQSVSQMPYFCTAGFAFRGISASRPVDVAAFGFVFGEFSSDLEHAQEREQLLDPMVGVQNHEAVLEWTYRFAFAKSAVFFQPDIQYIIHPGGAGQINNALVLGCQMGINF